jgi:transcriptional regulator with XRE-family HTH domain
MQTTASREFFLTFGKRIAQFRKQANLTQAQLAQKMGLKQQLVAAYEKGTRRIPLSYLKTLAQSLSVDIEDLLGVERRNGKRGPTPIFLKKMEQLQKLSPQKQKFVLDFLDTIVQGQ